MPQDDWVAVSVAVVDAASAVVAVPVEASPAGSVVVAVDPDSEGVVEEAVASDPEGVVVEAVASGPDGVVVEVVDAAAASSFFLASVSCCVFTIWFIFSVRDFRRFTVLSSTKVFW